MSGTDFETPESDRAAQTEPVWVEPERFADAAGEAAEGDLLDQAQEVDPGERVSPTRSGQDASEADVWEQAREVAPDDGWDDEREQDRGSAIPEG